MNEWKTTNFKDSFLIGESVYINVSEVAYAFYDDTGVDGVFLRIGFKGNSVPITFSAVSADAIWPKLRASLDVNKVL